MNKILIDPHYCSKEEYQELKDYVTEKFWDWQEISSGQKEILNERCELCSNMDSRGNHDRCSINRKVIDDVSKVPDWCPVNVTINK